MKEKIKWVDLKIGNVVTIVDDWGERQDIMIASINDLGIGTPMGGWIGRKTISSISLVQHMPVEI